MITVPEAARRVGRDPETIRRWIRAGRLAARKAGTRYVLDEEDLDALSRMRSFPRHQGGIDARWSTDAEHRRRHPQAARWALMLVVEASVAVHLAL